MRPATLLLIIVCTLASACGGARTKALQATHVSLNVARDTVLEVSRTRERQIVDDCDPPSCSYEEGRKRLDEWRARVDVVVDKIAAGYRLLAAAALADDARSFSDAIQAGKLAVDAARGLK